MEKTISNQEALEIYFAKVKKLNNLGTKVLGALISLWLFVIIYPWFNSEAQFACLIGLLILVFSTGVLSFIFDAEMYKERINLLLKSGFKVELYQHKIYLTDSEEKWEITDWTEHNSEVCFKAQRKEERRFYI